jgi:hypothetical protein
MPQTSRRACLLVSANEFEIEGLIVSTSYWKKNQSTTALLDKIVEACGRVLPNLRVHALGYLACESLKSLPVLGQTGCGMGDIGDGRDTKGSDLIIAPLDKAVARPDRHLARLRVPDGRTQASLPNFPDWRWPAAAAEISGPPGSSAGRRLHPPFTGAPARPPFPPGK